MRKLSRREFALASANTLLLGALSYTTLFEPSNLIISRHSLRLRGARSYPIRLLHLSDLHFSPQVPLSFIEHAIDLAIETNPDVICLTGDYITSKLSNVSLYADILRKLPAVAPTFATLGNHDGGAWSAQAGGYDSTKPVRELLRQANIRCLHNLRETVRLRGETLSIVGVGDSWSKEMEPTRAFSFHPDGEPTVQICLSHNPDTKQDLYKYRWDLMLSGHTHGGQLVVPFVGGTPFAPVQDHRYVWGLKPWRERFIHVTSGIGNVLGVRFNCPPEIAVIDLV